MFLSTFINRLDKKGRISIPSQFRHALGDAQSVVLFRSPTLNALEGFTPSRMGELLERLDGFDLFSSDQDDMATALFAEAVQLNIDTDGRIVLPEHLIEFGGFDDSVAFVGMGRKFQMWSPAAFEARKEEARTNVKKEGLTLPARSKDGA